MKTQLLPILILLFTVSAFGDAPLLEPQQVRACDDQVNFCVLSDPKGITSIYKISGNFKATETYKISGWFRAPHISPDGKYFVAGYSGLNLVPQDVTPEEVMVAIYKNGVLDKVIKLGELLHSMQSLKRTVSHYEWGYIKSVSNYGVELQTVEGSQFVEFPSYQIHRETKS